MGVVQAPSLGCLVLCCLSLWQPVAFEVTPHIKHSWSWSVRRSLRFFEAAHSVALFIGKKCKRVYTLA